VARAFKDQKEGDGIFCVVGDSSFDVGHRFRCASEIHIAKFEKASF
jgi:hypothetical protein